MKWRGKHVNIHPAAFLAFIVGLAWIGERIYDLWGKHV